MPLVGRFGAEGSFWPEASGLGVIDGAVGRGETNTLGIGEGEAAAPLGDGATVLGVDKASDWLSCLKSF